MTDTYDPLAARLHATTDAGIWAEQFIKLFGGRIVADDDIDFGLMVGWFANAIETGRTAGRSEMPVPEIEFTELEVPPTLVLIGEDQAINPAEVFAVVRTRHKDGEIVQVWASGGMKALTARGKTFEEVIAIINGEAGFDVPEDGEVGC